MVQQPVDGKANVAIYVACDVDSLCACHVITDLFQSNYIRFSVVPVSDSGDLQRAIARDADKGGEACSTIMINCGGGLDLWEMFGFAETDDRKDDRCYVLDHHRPYHLNNINENNHRIVLLDDGWLEETEKDGKKHYPEPWKVDDFDHQDADDTRSIGYESDSGSDSGSDRVSDAEEAVDRDFGVGRDDGGEGDEGSPPKRRKMSGNIEPDVMAADRRQKEMEKQQKERRKRQAELQAALKTYYGSTSYGKAASVLAYEIADQLNLDNNKLLWWAIVGLTDMYIHDRIDKDEYQNQVDQFTYEVRKSNSDEQRTMEADDGTVIPVAEDDQILAVDDYRFPLMRHWSLYESMFNSSYVAARLGVWDKNGADGLHSLLAKMGIPLREAQTPFQSMGTGIKNALDSLLTQHAMEFHIADFRFPSFERRQGFRVKISASDTVLIAASLLEFPDVVKSAPALLSNDGEEQVDPSVHEEAMRQAWMGKFYEAYKVLIPVDVESCLSEKLEKAQRLQEAIFKQGAALLSDKEHPIDRQWPFYYACIEDVHFTRPLTLARLTLFLMDALNEAGRPRKPFVISAYDKNKDSFLVLGWYFREDGHINEFGGDEGLFRDAVEQMAVDDRRSDDHDSFDSVFIDVKADALEPFINELIACCRVDNDDEDE